MKLWLKHLKEVNRRVKTFVQKYDSEGLIQACVSSTAHSVLT